MPLLLLVDGSSYLYRAFHALPDLRNQAGEPTGALYGVLNMLRRLQSDYKADYKAVVFDPRGKTFRDDWYPEYKSHRPPMPDDLARQIEPIHAAIKAAGWPVIMIDGVEADDVIGTLATQAAAADIDTLISTGDKDLTQLVGPKIRWYNTMSNELLDAAGVTAKFGVPPERIIDYLALVGDAVDGVPGVAKCGPKTAVKWLTQYGTLDNLVAHADAVSGVVGQNLRDHLGFLPLGKKLVTVVCDLPDLPAPTALTATPPDIPTLRELYKHYQFRSWLNEIDGPDAAAGIPAIDSIFADVNDMEGLRHETELIKRLGFTGKCMINPRQIDIIHEVFAPKQAEVDYALEVIDAIKRAREMGTGVISLKGKMIDRPIVVRAARVVNTARAHGMTDVVVNEEDIHGTE